jgi:GTP-binding protein Era
LAHSPMAHRSGFACILGRPNAGKSTLLNALVGEKLAIVTPKPQTTRNRIQGFLNVPKKGKRPPAQVVLIDTPGVHKPDSALGRKMMVEVSEALAGCNLVLLIVDATRAATLQDDFLLEMAKRASTPVFLLLNKIDLIEKGKLLPIIDQCRQLYEFGEILPISARKRQGLEELIDAVAAAMPPGPHHFPEDEITDLPVRFLAAELIRERVLLETGEEVPYAASVKIEQWEEGAKLTRIAAVIYCEREGQKGILVGRGGKMLKKIGTQARLEIERLVGTRVFLELFVKVRAGWRNSREFVEGLDWRRQLQDTARLTSDQGDVKNEPQKLNGPVTKKR